MDPKNREVTSANGQSAPHVRRIEAAMTCDVEDYFQVSAFSGLVPRTDWENVECRIPGNVDKILARLEQFDAKATFFTLGWVARHYPDVVRRISDAGHEVASHGMEHIRVWAQSPEEFLNDASESKKLLEDASGQPVRGYRAASWSMDSRTPWAWEKLAEAGYVYSSSLYPISHDHYGAPEAPATAFVHEASGILEVPASTTKLMGRRLPIAGGGYFRLYPLALSRWLIRRETRRDGDPYIFYFHPWEVDPDQPRIENADRRARFRHYLNLDTFEARWCSLLGDYTWRRMDELFLDGARA